jgi:hypothetical protein
MEIWLKAYIPGMFLRCKKFKRIKEAEGMIQESMDMANVVRSIHSLKNSDDNKLSSLFKKIKNNLEQTV